MKKLFTILTLTILVSCSSVVVKEKLDLSNKSDMNFQRFGFASVTDGKNIYAIGGGIGVSPFISNTIEKYNVIDDKWTLLTDKLTPRRYCNAEYIASQNKIYIFNGEYLSDQIRGLVNRVDIYDINTNEIITGIENPYPIKNAGSDTWNDKIYFFGGEDAHGFSDNLIEFDPSTNKWKKLANLPRAMQTNGKIIDGILYIFGGYRGGYTVLRNISAYNIKENKWSELGKLPVSISAHTTTVYGNKIWLVGAYNDKDFLGYYDTKTNEFVQFKSNMLSRRHAQSQILDQKLFVFGGIQSRSASDALKSTQSAELLVKDI